MVRRGKDHLDVGGHDRRRHRDDKGDIGASRRGKRRNPAALAQPPRSDAPRIDARIALQAPRGGDRVVGQDRKSAACILRARCARSAPVVSEDGDAQRGQGRLEMRSEEHTSELQSLIRTPYAVFCLKKKTASTRYLSTLKNKRT